LRLLLAKIGTVPCAAAGSANAACKIEQIKKFVQSDLVAALKDKEFKISDQQITDLHNSLDFVLAVVPPDNDLGLIKAMEAATKIAGSKPVVAPAPVIDSLDKLVLALQGQITAGTVKPAVPVTAGDVDKAVDSIARVSTNLGVILGALGVHNDLIRVVGAWYGDLGAIQQKLRSGGVTSLATTSSRYCSATRAVRALCERKGQCYGSADAASADGSTSEIDGAHLCGYDPAAFAEPSRKGLVVRYDCLSAQDGAWLTAALEDERIPDNPADRTQSRTAYEPAGVIPPGATEQGSNEVQLRSGVVAFIRCQPVSPPAAAAAEKRAGVEPKDASPGDTLSVTATMTGTTSKAAPAHPAGNAKGPVK
jgi:hypothetical protein